jgi:hypothetical protein
VDIYFTKEEIYTCGLWSYKKMFNIASYCKIVKPQGDTNYTHYVSSGIPNISEDEEQPELIPCQ